MCDTLSKYGLTREDLVHLVEGPWRRLRAVVERKVIDFHTHSFNPKGIKYARTLRERDELARSREVQDFTDDTILTMDVHGIAISCAQWPKFPGWTTYEDWLASLARYPDRFIESAYWIGYRDPNKKPSKEDAVEAAEFIRNRLKAGARMIGEGIELPGGAHLKPDAIAPIMEVVQEFDVPVLLGTRASAITGVVFGAARQPEVYVPIIQAYPKVNFVIGDGGGKGFAMGGGWMAVMVASVFENAHYEISGAPVSVVEMAVRTLGAHRVLFGSDQGQADIRYYLPQGQWDSYLQWRNLNAVALADLSEAERDMVLHKNARRLLKLDD